jgi:hypothetical protein
MHRRLGPIAVLASLVAAILVGVLWLHSVRVGYQRTWSDARTQTCGRFASAQGRILWQQCDLKFPASGMVWGLETSRSLSSDFGKKTRWAHSWSEYTVSYWPFMVLALLGPCLVFISWVWKRSRSPAPADEVVEGATALGRGAP